MNQDFVAPIVILGALAVWSLVSKPLTRAQITGPIALIALGLVVGWQASAGLIDHLTDAAPERLVEIVLSLLLFLDAMHVKHSIRHSRIPLLRILFIGVPLSLLMTAIAAAYVFPDLRLSMCLVLACILVPTDMAPAASFLHDERVPSRVRDLLNTESGYNDGIVAPVFTFALALLGQGEHVNDPMDAFHDVIPAALIAIVSGLVIGWLGAQAARFTHDRGWADVAALRLFVITVPLLTYVVAVGFKGNGFVAAFVAGLAFRSVLGPLEDEVLELCEDVATLSTLAVWFIVGQLLALVLTLGIDKQALLLAFLALTVTRIIPVLLCVIPSRLRWRERFAVAWLGPRGVASIVFALLAFHEGEQEQVDLILQAVVLVVVMSVVLHGLTARPVGRWLAVSEDGSGDGDHADEGTTDSDDADTPDGGPSDGDGSAPTRRTGSTKVPRRGLLSPDELTSSTTGVTPA